MNKLSDMDPRALIVTTSVAVSVSVLSGGDLLTDTALAAVFFLLLVAASRARFAIRAILLLAAVHIFAVIADETSSEAVSRSIWILAEISRKIFFIICSAIFLLSTITVGDCIKSLEKMKIPWVVILPLAICLRVLPALKHEGKIIRDALKIRGLYSVKRILRHPLQTMELFLMTLLFRVMVIGEDLAFSVSTRATSGHRKSWYKEKSLSMKDFVFSLMVLGAVSVVVLAPWQILVSSGNMF